jgi:hypothetical protein
VSIDALISEMEELLVPLEAAGDARRFFHATYLRTTRAVRHAVRAGLFSDPGWVERWDVAFARRYLDALRADASGDAVPQPWAIAFGAARDKPAAPALRHVLLGMNAHINYDLPQALLAVISTSEFHDPAVTSRRRADHRRIDEVLSRRVGAEDAELAQLGPRSVADSLLVPLNQAASRRFLRESRAKVWDNAVELNAARALGATAYAERLADLEKLSGARVAELVRPGQVLLRLAMHGFGVRLVARSRAPGHRSLTRHRASAGQAPGRLRSFDPVKVADLEFRAWVGYYRRDWLGVLRASVSLVRAGFGMDWPRTLHGAWLVLRGNQLWAPADNDPDGARRCMRRFYSLVRAAYGEPRDVTEAARLEVEWWRVHRGVQRGEKPPSPEAVEELVQALQRLYAHTYRVDPAEVRLAAEQRAEAMRLSDEWVRDGHHRGSPLVAQERAALVRSYAALLAAVHTA